MSDEPEIHTPEDVNGSPPEGTPDAANQTAGQRIWNGIHDNFLRILIQYPFLSALAVMALVAELGYAILNIATLPLHISVDLNAPETNGWVLATFLLVEAVFKSPFGALGDKIGRKPLMVLGPLWSSFCCLTMYYLTRPWQYIIVHGLNGLGFAAFWPACFATIAARVRKQDMNLAMSVFNLTYMLGVALGPLAKTLAGNQDIRAQLIGRMARRAVREQDRVWLLSHTRRHLVPLHEHILHVAVARARATGEVLRMNSYVVEQRAAHFGLVNHHLFPFIMVACLFLGTALLGVLLAPGRLDGKPDPVAQEDQASNGSPDERAAASQNPHGGSSVGLGEQIAIGIKTVPWMMLIAFLIFLGIGFLTPNIMMYALRVYNISERQFGVLLLPIAGMIGVLALPLGRLGDQWGTTRAIRLGMAACTIGVWLVTVQPLVGQWLAPSHPAAGAVIGSHWVMAALMAVVGLGFVVANPAWMARVTHMATGQTKGSVIGAASMAQGGGALLGQIIGGYLWAACQERFPEGLMFACAIFLTLGTLVTFWHVRRDILPEADQD